MDARRTTPRLAAYDELRHYPALLALRATSVEAIRLGKDDVLIELLTKPRWNPRTDGQQPMRAAGALHLNWVLNGDMVNRSQRWQGKIYPGSHLLKHHLKKFFTEQQDVDDQLYTSLCDDVEYRTGLIQQLLPPKESGFGGANAGEFVHPQFWRPGGEITPDDQWAEVPLAELRFREDYERRTAAAWSHRFGEKSREDILTDYRSVLTRYRRYR
jgi:hypothetical protein